MPVSDNGGRDRLAPAPTLSAPKPHHAADVQSLLESMMRDISPSERPVSIEWAPKLGVDVVDIDVLARQLASPIGTNFKLRIFTATEIADCRNQAAKFATRWAVKEAVSKAIGTGFRAGLHPSAIEVRTAPDGSINVAPAIECQWPNGAENWCWTVSAAHERNLAVAVVLALP